MAIKKTFRVVLGVTYWLLLTVAILMAVFYDYDGDTCDSCVQAENQLGYTVSIRTENSVCILIPEDLYGCPIRQVKFYLDKSDDACKGYPDEQVVEFLEPKTYK